MAVRRIEISQDIYVAPLTRYGCRCLEDLQHLLVHGDVHVFLDGHLLVASLNLDLHLVGELFLEHGRANVGKPLFRDLRQLQVRLRQVGVHLRMVLVQELSDFLDTKPFESEDRKSEKGE